MNLCILTSDDLIRSRRNLVDEHRRRVQLVELQREQQQQK